MPITEDRGRIVRITFDVVYSTGQMKTVAMNMSDSDWGNTAVIALSEQGVRDILAPGLDAQGANSTGEDAINLFASTDDDTNLKPAMLIVANDGRVTVHCGAHQSISHAQVGEPLARFI
jgi:hypothetical protein